MKIHSFDNIIIHKSSHGFTLVEVIVVMAIFTIVVGLSGYAFNNLVSVSTKQTRSAETQISGIVGLELMRWDLEHAGYGLPWSFLIEPVYSEASSAANSPVAGINAADYNDSVPAGSDNPPRAFVVGHSTKYLDGSSASGSDGPAYLVVKSSLANMNGASRKWSFVDYLEAGGALQGAIRQWADGSNPAIGERVILIKSQFSIESGENRQLINKDTGSEISNFYTIPDPPEVITDEAFVPKSAFDRYLLFVVDTATDPRMPFNRADFFIDRPAGVPERCAPNTGILFKGILDQASGGIPAGNRIPLLDCVADMKVYFDIDYGDGSISVKPVLVNQTNTTAMTAAEIRSQVKGIKIYVLTHEGGIDKSYTYPSETVAVGPATTFNLKTRVHNNEWSNYRWKVYVLSVKPKNLKF